MALEILKGFRCCGSSVCHITLKEGRYVIEKSYALTSKSEEYFSINKQNFSDIELFKHDYKKAKIWIYVLTSTKEYRLTYEQFIDAVIDAIRNNNIIPIKRNKTIVLWKIPFKHEWEIELDENKRKRIIEQIEDADRNAEKTSKRMRERNMKYAKSSIFLNNLKNEGS